MNPPLLLSARVASRHVRELMGKTLLPPPVEPVWKRKGGGENGIALGE